jgi:hypothetical protein
MRQGKLYKKQIKNYEAPFPTDQMLKVQIERKKTKSMRPI